MKFLQSGCSKFVFRSEVEEFIVRRQMPKLHNKLRSLQTSTNLGNPRPTSAKLDQPLSTSANLGQHRPTSANLCKPRPTSANL